MRELLVELLSCRPGSHSGLEYEIHLIKDNTVNAFTAGGQIFVYSGMLDFCETISELACIVAHEIGHNELGHINLTLKRYKIAGNFSLYAMNIKKLMAASFNQFNELECDFYGADIAYAAGYNPEAGANLWKRMAERKNEEKNMINKFFTTHPFSSERYECLNQYVREHHNIGKD